MTKHITHCLAAAARHPRIALWGAREYREINGLSFENPSKSEAYDAGREIAHIMTFRRYDA